MAESTIPKRKDDIPSIVSHASVSEENRPISMNIQVICKEDGLPINVGRQGSCNTTVRTHNHEPEISIGDVEIPGPPIKSQT